MNVLSLFDGISCGQVALERLGIKVNKYFASEIKKDAIKVCVDNYPNTIQLGDVRDIDYSKLPKIDLLIGGSPCQDLSQANKERLGLKGNKSSLFWEYVRALKETKPKYFLFENVKMPEKDFAIITKELGTYPININSQLVSCQLRNRFYWTNIGRFYIDLLGFRHCDIEQPKDKKIFLQDMLTSGKVEKLKANCLMESDSRPSKNQKKMLRRYRKFGFSTLVFEDNYHRYLNQTELERCQTLPKGFTKILNRNKAAGVIGDGWTIDVIVHILQFINKNNNKLKETK
jgi:DNA (cytosine-5)-methyltransferase 3A